MEALHTWTLVAPSNCTLIHDSQLVSTECMSSLFIEIFNALAYLLPLYSFLNFSLVCKQQINVLANYAETVGGRYLGNSLFVVKTTGGVYPELSVINCLYLNIFLCCTSTCYEASQSLQKFNPRDLRVPPYLLLLISSIILFVVGSHSRAQIFKNIDA